MASLTFFRAVRLGSPKRESESFHRRDQAQAFAKRRTTPKSKGGAGDRKSWVVQSIRNLERYKDGKVVGRF